MKSSAVYKYQSDLETRVYEYPGYIPREDWNLATNGVFYSSVDFLSALIQANVENAAYRYLLFYSEKGPLGAAVLSRFNLNLDLLAGIPWITKLKKIMPSFLRIPMICCGIPSSFGQLSMHVVDQEFIEKITHAIHFQMRKWASETGINLLVWKELPDKHAALSELSKLEYTHVPTLPDYQLHNLPDSIDEFLDDLRSNYKRKYKAVLPILRQNGAEIVYTKEEFQIHHAADFYPGYKALMQRTPVKLEHYNPLFFSLLTAVKDFEIKLHSISKDHHEIKALVAKNGDHQYLMLISKSEIQYADHLYEKLLHLIVLHAIECGTKTLFLGQTSDYSKACLGARPQLLHASIFFSRTIKNSIFKRFGKWLFPDNAGEFKHVFKQESSQI